VIRPVTPADAPRLQELTAATGFFKPADLEALREVLDDYFASPDEGHRCVALVEEGEGGRIVGYAYYAEAAMTDRSWYLWWIAVDPSIQGKGLGRELMRHVEEDAGRHGCRLMFIETSSTALYEPTRRFYLRLGYEKEALLRDYYSEGDGMVVFRKRLSGEEGGKQS
jgi:ribosomal protein S18 acetylase RimI-like enzyme